MKPHLYILLDSNFHNDIVLSFLEQHKTQFYAMCYGGAKASQHFNDFHSMLCSRGEL